MRQGTRAAIPRAAWGWLLAACVPLLQWGIGRLDFRGDAILGFLYFSGAGIALIVGSRLAAQLQRFVVLRIIALFILVSCLASMAVALQQWLGQVPWSWWSMELIDDRPYGNFAQPNLFGLAIVMSIVATLWLYESGVIRERWVAVLAIVFLAQGILISQARASGLALVLLFGLWWMLRARLQPRTSLGMLLVVTVLSIATFAAALQFQQLLAPPVEAARSVVGVGHRHLIWLHFLTAVLQQPWLGYGFNQGVAALAAVSDQVTPSENVSFAHNLAIDLLAWFGIPVALAMAAGFMAWVMPWLRRIDDIALMRDRALACAVWLALLVQSMLEFPYAHAFFLLPAALLAGAVAGPGRPIRLRAPLRHLEVAIFPALALVVASLFVLLCRDYVRAEADFRQNRFARASFIGASQQTAQSDLLILDQLATLNASAAVTPGAAVDRAQLEDLRRLARRFNIISVRLAYAQALHASGDRAGANREIRLMKGIYGEQRFRQIEQQWVNWQAQQGGPDVR